MRVIIYCYGDGHPMMLGLDNLTEADRQSILLKLKVSKQPSHQRKSD